MKLVDLSKKAYDLAGEKDSNELQDIEREIDEIVWEAFGLVKE